MDLWFFEYNDYNDFDNIVSTQWIPFTSTDSTLMISMTSILFSHPIIPYDIPYYTYFEL